MSEQAPNLQPPSAQQTSPDMAVHKPKPGNPLVSFLSRLSIGQMTLGLLVVIFLWQWFDAHHQIVQVREELAKRLSDTDASNKANQMLLAQNQEIVRELGGKLSLLENKFADTQNQRAALEALYQEISGSRDQTAITEVEQMLLLAEQQLQISGNVKAAVIALQQADSRLKQLDRPGLAGLRKIINQDLDELRALPNVDVAEINLHLDNLVSVVDTLPLIQDAPAQAEKTSSNPPASSSAWKNFWQELWQEARKLVRIENTQKDELPLLSPSQAFFLKENLKIRLLSSRLALLARDQDSFRHDLKSAQEWIKQYFDTRSQAGAQALQTLQKLAASDIAVDLPDIRDSLEALRNYRSSHEKGAR